MADISKITLPGGTTYNIKDAVAREAIADLESYTEYLGVTTTPLTDGANTNPIKINNVDVTAKKGEIANYGSKEFIFNGSVWQEFGDMSGLKALAFKDSASTSYKPAGTISFTNSNKTATVSKASSGTATYTPEGSVAAPTISLKTAGATKSVTGIDTVGTLPSCTLPTFTYASETLTITAGSYTNGTLPTKQTAVTVKTGDGVYEATAPTFTGTGARLVTGNISVPSSATFTGTDATITVE